MRSNTITYHGNGMISLGGIFSAEELKSIADSVKNDEMAEGGEPYSVAIGYLSGEDER